MANIVEFFFQNDSSKVFILFYQTVSGAHVGVLTSEMLNFSNSMKPEPSIVDNSIYTNTYIQTNALQFGLAKEREAQTADIV